MRPSTEPSCGLLPPAGLEKNQEGTCREMGVRPDDAVLEGGGSWGSAGRGDSCGLIPCSWTCLGLRGSLHGTVLLCGSDLDATSPPSGWFSFLASDLMSSAEMNQETPGGTEPPVRQRSDGHTVVCARCTLSFHCESPAPLLLLSRWSVVGAPLSCRCHYAGRWRGERGSHVSGLASGRVTDDLQVAWRKSLQLLQWPHVWMFTTFPSADVCEQTPRSDVRTRPTHQESLHKYYQDFFSWEKKRKSIQTVKHLYI